MAVSITRAQYLALRALSDGQWHQGKRVSETGTVLSTVGSALWRAGLAERRGASRIIPRNPGFEYRITEAGEAAIDAYIGGING